MFHPQYQICKIMQQLDFNTLDNQTANGNLNRLAEQAQQAIQQMQTAVPEPFLPGHVVPPIIQKQMENEQRRKEEQ